MGGGGDCRRDGCGEGTLPCVGGKPSKGWKVLCSSLNIRTWGDWR